MRIAGYPKTAFEINGERFDLPPSGIEDVTAEEFVYLPGRPLLRVGRLLGGDELPAPLDGRVLTLMMPGADSNVATLQVVGNNPPDNESPATAASSSADRRPRRRVAPARTEAADGRASAEAPIASALCRAGADRELLAQESEGLPDPIDP